MLPVPLPLLAVVAFDVGIAGCAVGPCYILPIENKMMIIE